MIGAIDSFKKYLNKYADYSEIETKLYKHPSRSMDLVELGIVEREPLFRPTMLDSLLYSFSDDEHDMAILLAQRKESLKKFQVRIDCC